MMSSLPDQFHALVPGASGAIGTAFVDLLASSSRCASVRGLHRHSTPRLDFSDENSVADAARVLGAGPRYHLIIGDNRLGGWYSYRASKAALNMLVKTAAIEVARSQKNSVLVALHPGTVSSRLSQTFRGESIGRPARDADADMLHVIDALTPADSGSSDRTTAPNCPGSQACMRTRP